MEDGMYRVHLLMIDSIKKYSIKQQMNKFNTIKHNTIIYIVFHYIYYLFILYKEIIFSIYARKRDSYRNAVFGMDAKKVSKKKVRCKNCTILSNVHCNKGHFQHISARSGVNRSYIKHNEFSSTYYYIARYTVYVKY